IMNLVGGLADQHVDNVADTEDFSRAIDSREGKSCCLRAVPLFLRRKAIVTVVAAHAVWFSKVIEQAMTTTSAALAKSEQRVQFSLFDLLDVIARCTVIRHLSMDDRSLHTVGYNGLRKQAVAPCSTGLLVIRFYALRHIEMRYEPNIRLVYAHAKRDR